MAYPAQPLDGSVSPIPLSSAYNPITALFKAMRGGNKITDASSNDSYALATSNEDGWKATYAASMQALVAVTGCTDLFTITGSATKTVKVTRISVVGSTITTPINYEIQIIKRSTADTAGTSSAPTNLVALDSTNAAATATVLGYTANPTLGTVAGIVDASKHILNIAPSATMETAPDRYVREWGIRPAQCPTLRGIAQVLAVNLVATTFGTAATFDVAVEWSEE